MKELTKAIYPQKIVSTSKNKEIVFETTCQNTIVEITDLGQIEKQTSKQFIRYVNLFLKISAFVASNRQLNDVERFCT